jgi:hypothetical protein
LEGNVPMIGKTLGHYQVVEKVGGGDDIFI